MLIYCNNCQIKFHRKKSQLKKNNFCSRKCFYIFRKNQDPNEKFINKLTKSIWTNMNIRCGKYKHLQTRNKCDCYKNIKIEITRDELKNWLSGQINYLKTLKRPSIDRVNSEKGYLLSNIQMIELKNNIKKSKFGGMYINGPKMGTLRGIKKEGRGYSARISINGKTKHIGSFKTKNQAYRAFYDEYVKYRNEEPFNLELLKGE